MKKSTLFMIVSVVLALTLSLGGTLAYLTDTDYDTNVMVLGNIDIEQHENDRHGNTFVQGQMLLPIVGSASEKDYNGYPAPQNYIDKIVTVENVGNYDAYVRTFIAVPVYSYEGQDKDNASFNVLHWNGYAQGHAAPKYPAAEQYPGKNPDGTANFTKGLTNNWYWGKENTAAWPGNGGDWNSFSAVINDQDYKVYVVTNLEKVAPGERTAPNMIGLYLDSNVDYNGTNYTYDGKVIEKFDGTVEVLVATQAVQYDKGWDSAFDALNTAFYEPDADNHPWVEEAPLSVIKNVTPENAQEVISTAVAGDIIMLGEGTYEWLTIADGEGNAKDGITIVGENATVGVLDLHASSNITINSLKFDAAKAGPTYYAANGKGERSDARANIADHTEKGEAGVKNIVIKNCTFAGTNDNVDTYYPIFFNEQGSQGVRAHNITIDSCVFACNAMQYVNLSYLNTGVTTIRNNVFGTAAFGTEHNNINATGNSSDFLIEGNKFVNWNPEKTAFGSSRQAGATENVDFVIRNNEFAIADSTYINLKPADYTAGTFSIFQHGNTVNGVAYDDEIYRETVGGVVSQKP